MELGEYAVLGVTTLTTMLYVAKKSRLVDDIRGWIWGHETQLARMQDRVEALEHHLTLRDQEIAKLEERIEQLPRIGPYR